MRVCFSILLSLLFLTLVGAFSAEHSNADDFSQKPLPPGLSREQFELQMQSQQTMMLEGFIVSGTVVDLGGQPIDSIEVGIYRPEPFFYALTLTDENGVFQFEEIPMGDYHIFCNGTVIDNGNRVKRYIYQYTDGSASWREAEAIPVETNVRNIHFSMDPGYHIAGRVVDKNSGTPVYQAIIDLYETPFEHIQDTYASSWSDAEGYFFIGGLRQGEYLLFQTGLVWDSGLGGPAETFIPYFYVNSATPQEADPIAVPDSRDDIFLEVEGGTSCSGKLVDQSTGRGIYTALVRLLDKNGQKVSEIETNASGNYTFSNIGIDEYYIYAPGIILRRIGNEWNVPLNRYAGRYYDDAIHIEDAHLFEANQNYENIDFTLEPFVAIKGRVTRADNGRPIINTWVEADNGLEGDLHRHFSAITDDNGEYALMVVKGGYYIAATGGVQQEGGQESKMFVTEYYDNVHERSLATLLQVDEEISGIDFTLETGFTLSGRITNQSDGSPVAGVSVLLYDRIDGDWIGNTLTDSNGDYQIGGLPADTFYVGSDGNVRLSDQEFERQYLPGFYENADKLEDATPIILSADRSGINISLEKGVILSGSVTCAEDDSAIPFARLSLVDSTGESVYWTIADSAGNYEFEGISRGSYYVVAEGDVETPQGPQQAFVRTWYAGAFTMQEAMPVDISQNRDGIDIKVPKGFSLSGRLTEKGTGAPVSDIDVRILDQQYEEILVTRTDADGQYTISGLPPGQYYIEATGVNVQTWQHTHQTGYYPGVENREEATLIDVQSDSSGFDFSIYRVKSISGRVMNEDATMPISNIEVNLYDSQWHHLGNMPTDSSGVFEFMQVSADSVYLHATGFNPYLQKTVFKEEYYPEASSRDGAELIPLAGDSSGFVFTLEKGITLSGYVSDAKSGLPVAHADVEILAPDFEFIAAASTDSAGLYQISTLDSGSYYLRASGWVRPWQEEHRQVYQEKYYPQAEQQEEAELIRIVQDSCCFNFSLSKGAGINGRVVDEENQPVQGAIIELLNQNEEQVMSTESDAQGYYRFSGISKESYYLFCFGTVHPDNSWEWEKRYQQNWYPNSPYRQGAELVVVDGEVSGIDFVLKSGFSLSGRVMRSTDSLAVKEMFLTLYSENWSHLFQVTSDSNGFYSFNGLLPENYYLEVTGRIWDADLNLEKEIYYRQYYPAVGRQDSAETLAVDSDLNGIDFYLRPSAFVCGRIYTYDGAVPISNMRILLYDSLWQVVREEQTWLDGRYTIGGFDDGSYYLCATGGIWNESIFWFDDRYLPVYYPQARDSTEAQLLKIEGELTGIDFMTKLLTQVEEEKIALPQTYELQIYPNPFNPQTRIEYALPTAQEINISIFNVRGQKIRTLLDGYQHAGNHTLVWRADNDRYVPVAGGIYFCVFRNENKIVRTQKMLFLK